MKAWKKFEADSAAIFGGKRHWANSGEREDFETPWAVGQCKLVKALSLDALSKLAEEMEAAGLTKKKLGVVCVKVRRGRGCQSAPLVVMTFRQFEHWFTTKGVTHGQAEGGNDAAVPVVAAG